MMKASGVLSASTGRRNRTEVVSKISCRKKKRLIQRFTTIVECLSSPMRVRKSERSGCPAIYVAPESSWTDYFRPLAYIRRGKEIKRSFIHSVLTPPNRHGTRVRCRLRPISFPLQLLPHFMPQASNYSIMTNDSKKEKEKERNKAKRKREKNPPLPSVYN